MCNSARHVSVRPNPPGNGVGSLLAKGVTGRFIVTVTGAGIAFGVQALLARLLGVRQFGIFIYALSWLNMLVVFARLGFDTALLRYAAAYNAGGEWGKFRGILGKSQRAVLFSSAGMGCCGAIVVLLLGNSLEKELLCAFLISFVALPVFVLSGLRQAALRSLKSVVLAQLPESIVRPLLLALFAGILFFISSSLLRASSVMGLNLLAACLSFILSTYWLAKRLPDQVRASESEYAGSEWLNAALPLLFISAANMAISQADTIMVGFFRGTAEAGIYNAASRGATLILFGLTAVNAVAAPVISELYAQGRMKELQQMATLAARGIFLYSAPAFLVVAVSGKWILELFGAAFVSGYVALLTLSAAQLINACSGSVGLLMTMTGHHREAAWVMGGGAVLNILLNAVLIPPYGIEGAAVATALTIVIWNASMFIFVRKKLGINSSVFRFRKEDKNVNQTELSYCRSSQKRHDITI